MISAHDLAAAFEKAGLYGLSIHRRGEQFGSKWYVEASLSEKNWLLPAGDKKRRIATALNSSLEAALVEILNFTPENPEFNAEDMI